MEHHPRSTPNHISFGSNSIAKHDKKNEKYISKNNNKLGVDGKDGFYLFSVDYNLNMNEFLSNYRLMS